MGIILTPFQVSTNDNNPFDPPHRISRKVDQDYVAWLAALSQDGLAYPDEFLPEDDNSGLPFGEQHVVGTMVRQGGGTPNTGDLIEAHGLACSEALACSEQLTVSEGIDYTELDPNVSGSLQVYVSSLGPGFEGDADGEYTIYIHLQVEAQGWV